MKSLIRIAGWIVSIACLALFLRHVTRVGLDIPNRALFTSALFLFGGATVYGLGVGGLALAWGGMLRAGLDKPKMVPLLSSYLVAQFAKYLPGNVFQYAARHGLGIAAGASHTALVGTAFAEVYLLLCCGAAIAIVAGAPVLEILAPGWPPLSGWLSLVPLGAAFAVSLPARMFPKLSWLPHLSLSVVATVSCSYLVFFTLFGSLYLLCLTWTTATWPSFVYVNGAAAAAWVAGFVIPGPPAGAGVREAALTFGAGHNLPAAEVAAAIVLFRLITLGGDFLAFATGLFLSRVASRTTQAKREDVAG
jgi:uncharacterized membrane protein YbhN (UPF0104 family)